MGGCCSTEKVEPVGTEDVSSSPIKRRNRDEFDGPVEGRTCTDIVGIILLIMFAGSLFALLAHCISNGDVFRVIYGYDNCGNICGRVTPNETDPRFKCKGADYRDKKYLLIKEAGKAIFSPKNVHKECVADCKAYPDYRTFLYRCIPKLKGDVVNTYVTNTGIKDFFHEVSQDLHLAWLEMLYLAIISLVISIVILFALRFCAGFMIWTTLIGAIGMGITGTTYAWIVWKQKKHEQNESDIASRVANTYLAYAIIATVTTVIVFLIVVVLRKRIKLVSQLFEEAGKALSIMPLLLFQPLVTFLSFAFFVSLWIYCCIWIESSGYLTYNVPSFYYKKDFAMKFTRWYNLFGIYWMIQFCIGCQHMVIAGAVATWFFTRNKENLKSPISTSLANLIRYHLGSVALGSLFIALLQLVRTLLKKFEDTLKDSQNDIGRALFKACHCCLWCFEKCLAYITRNAYIEIAIYGHNFCQSGQQAFQVLVNNALRVAAINTIGDFVLFLGKVFVVCSTVFIGTFLLEGREGIQHIWVPLSLVAIFAYLVSHAFLSVYEMAIDTIFICFCEDCEINDGQEKPYYMSTDLMKFVVNTKKILKVGNNPRSNGDDLPMTPTK